MRKEEWKPVVGYEGLYNISSLGRVWSIKSKIYLKNGFCKGYLNVTLYKNKKPKTFLLHRLVAITFIPNPDNLPQVNHKDENIYNNTVENLEWCTHKYNINYGTGIERHTKTQTNDHRSMPVEMLTMNYEHEMFFESINEAARQTGINKANICNNCHNRCKSIGGHRFRFSNSY